MNFPWFRRTGLIYLPISFPGWMILLAGLACSAYVFTDIDRRSHSASDTLINFAFNFLIIGAVYTLIAFLTGRPARK